MENKKIPPRGRGMIKWAPFAAIPEQYIGIQKILEDQTKIPKPVLAQDKLEEIERTLIDAINRDTTVCIYYYSSGFVLTEEVKVKKIWNDAKIVDFIELSGLPLTLKFDEIIDTK
ncbi:YolD-like family protein [Bacillus luti]